MNKYKIEHIEYLLALIFFCIFLIYFVPTANKEIRIHDNLDSNITSRHLLIKSGHFFETDPTKVISGSMNGLPRSTYSRFTEITSLLMLLFGTLNGLSITFIIVRCFGFLGFWYLCKDHLPLAKENLGLLALFSVSFACLPVFYIHGLSILGVPIIFWSFLNIYKRKKLLISYGTLLLYVLWSSLVFVGVHLGISLGILFLILSISQRKVSYSFLMALSFFTLTYILSDYMLFYQFFLNSGYESAREDIIFASDLGFDKVILRSIRNIFSGDYSSANYFGFIFFPAFLYSIIHFNKNRNSINHQIAFGLLLTIGIFSLLINVLDWGRMSFFFEAFPLAKIFNFKRFTSVLPSIFFIVAFLIYSIINLEKRNKIRHLMTSSLIFLMIMIWRGNVNFNRSGAYNVGIKTTGKDITTFNEYIDSELYREIIEEIGEDKKYNLIHFGMQSSASKYAGLSVLDDYQSDYPLSYKREFRKIIAGELKRSPAWSDYFDNWGLRCYMESAESFEKKLSIKNGSPYQEVLSIDTKQIQAMNGKFILSKIMIGNTDQLNLVLRKTFTCLTEEKVFLYEIQS